MGVESLIPMVKVRIIPVLLLRNGRMVKPIQFGASGERDVGWPVTTARIYDSQDADELVFLDITATAEGRIFLIDTLREVGENCFMPLTAGGGVRRIEDIHGLLKAGADKVSINTAALERPEFIREAADRFGSQCVVLAVDVKKRPDGTYEVFSERGAKPTGLELVSWVRRAAELGAGEILLTAIEREGTMTGYDLECIRLAANAVSVPVIANGGAGTRQHFVAAVNAGRASAVAASSVFHFSDSNLTQVKSFMHNAGIAVRPI